MRVQRCPGEGCLTVQQCCRKSRQFEEATDKIMSVFNVLVADEYGPFIASNFRMMPKLTPITIRSILARANAGQILWSIFTLNEYDPSTIGLSGALRKQLEKKMPKLPDSKIGREIYRSALLGLKLSELSAEHSAAARRLGQESDKSLFRQRYIPTSVTLNSRRVAARRLAIR